MAAGLKRLIQEDGMFIVPCSMKTLAGVARDIRRTWSRVDVVLKEGRPLLLSPRDAVQLNHLENMLKLARPGVKIARWSPVLSWARSIDDPFDFMAGAILDAMSRAVSTNAGNKDDDFCKESAHFDFCDCINVGACHLVFTVFAAVPLNPWLLLLII
jgi:hypothetical protein